MYVAVQTTLSLAQLEGKLDTNRSAVNSNSTTSILTFGDCPT